MDQAPARIDRRMIQQPCNGRGAPSTRVQAVTLGRLFGDMDVDRAITQGR